MYCMNTVLLPTLIADENKRMINSLWWGRKNNNSRGLNWLRWDKLCIWMEFGGLGFRDFYGFNVSMLEKQGLRLLAKPDAIIGHVFKAKYYLIRNFLNANLGHNRSYSWHSIWASQVVISRGYRW